MKRLLVLAIVLIASTATASPFFDPYQFGALFTGPTSAHPSSAYWNPAATGLMRGHHLYWMGSAHRDLYQVDRASIDLDTGEPVDSGNMRGFESASGSLITPGAGFAFSSDLRTDKITIGVTIGMPYTDDQPNYQPDFRYHTRGGSLYTYQATFSFSYRPWWNWTFGFGGSLLFARNHVRFSFDEALEDCAQAPCDTENPEHTADFDIEAGDETNFGGTFPSWNPFDWNNPLSGASPKFGFNLGVLHKRTSRLWLAATYHSRPGFGPLSYSGDVSVTRQEKQTDGTFVSHTARGAATVIYRLPQMIQLAARYDLVPGSWQLAAAYRWVQTSALDQLDLRMAGPQLRDFDVREWMVRYRGIDDSHQLDVSLETPPGLARRWGVRLHGELGGVARDHLSPAQIGGPELSLSLGVAQPLGRGLSLTLAGTAGWVFAGEVDDSVYKPSEQTACVKSGYNLEDCADARRGSSINTAAGSYARQNLGLMLGLTLDLL